jgi:fructose/tagatose bisphosphate aldolase
MPLESIPSLMAAAQRWGYAVGYFESWNMESLQGVLDAAEQTGSPIIIGFNGEFLSNRPAGSPEDLQVYGQMGKQLATAAKVPCGFIFNECPLDNWTERAIHSGFNLVMPADPNASLEDYTRRVGRLAEIAHRNDVAIEAEIDELPQGDHEGALSDPRVAANFVKQTKVDLLAVSVGNEHIKLEGRAPLDLAQLERLQRVLGIPMVLHGGTGIEDESLKAAINYGVRKVNFGTYIKQQYLADLRTALQSDERNPHLLIGGGTDRDIVVMCRTIVRDTVMARIGALGCSGKA